jgi:hypothetical protein
MVLNSDVKPASVLGGKNSKLIVGSPDVNSLSIRMRDDLKP